MAYRSEEYNAYVELLMRQGLPRGRARRMADEEWERRYLGPQTSEAVVDSPAGDVETSRIPEYLDGVSDGLSLIFLLLTIKKGVEGGVEIGKAAAPGLSKLI